MEVFSVKIKKFGETTIAKTNNPRISRYKLDKTPQVIFFVLNNNDIRKIVKKSGRNVEKLGRYGLNIMEPVSSKGKEIIR